MCSQGLMWDSAGRRTLKLVVIPQCGEKNHNSQLSRLLWQMVRSGERLDPNADTDNGLELRVSLYYGRAEYKQKQKVAMTKLAKPKLGET